MKNNVAYKANSPFFVVASLVLIILLPTIFIFVLPFSTTPHTEVYIREAIIVCANIIGVACMYMAFRQVAEAQRQQQEAFLQQLMLQHNTNHTCEQAEKYYKEIKVEWDKLTYKRCPLDNHTGHPKMIEEVYTGGDALDKYYEDIREYGEDFLAHTTDVEYHLRYILLLMKSFLTDLQNCDLPAMHKKQLFKAFFCFYSAKIEFHFEQFCAETEGLAPFIQLHDDIEEVQSMIEALADEYAICSPNN